jgi:hypothetical protein
LSACAAFFVSLQIALARAVKSALAAWLLLLAPLPPDVREPPPQPASRSASSANDASAHRG